VYLFAFVGFVTTCNACLAVTGRLLFLSSTLLVSVSKYCRVGVEVLLPSEVNIDLLSSGMATV
jgi:hypothetical protein